MFCEICKIVYWKIDFGLLQEDHFLAISIYLPLGLSEKRIYFEKKHVLWNLQTLYWKIDLGLLQEGRFLVSSIYLSVGLFEKRI